MYYLLKLNCCKDVYIIFYYFVDENLLLILKSWDVNTIHQDFLFSKYKLFLFQNFRTASY